MGPKSKTFSQGLEKLVRGCVMLKPDQTRALAAKFITIQKGVCEILAALVYPVDRMMQEIRAGSVDLAREGTDKKGGSKKGAKKVGYRFSGFTRQHAEDYAKFVEERDQGNLSTDEISQWIVDFLIQFDYDVIEKVAERSMPVPVGTKGGGNFKRLRLRLADALEDATELRDEIIKGNLRLIYKEARKFTYDNVEPDDLFSAGVDGLRKAVNGYDPSVAKFSTRALPWIRLAVTRYAKSNNPPYRLPEHQMDRILKMKREGLAPTGPNDIMPIAIPIHSPESVGDDAGFTLAEVIPDKANNPPSKEAEQKDVKSLIHHGLQQLDQLSQLVMALRYDIGDPESIANKMFRAEVQLSSKRRQRLVEEARKTGDSPAAIRLVRGQDGQMK